MIHKIDVWKTFFQIMFYGEQQFGDVLFETFFNLNLVVESNIVYESKKCFALAIIGGFADQLHKI